MKPAVAGQSDRELALRFQKTRDKQLFAQLYERNFERTYRFLYGRIGNKTDTEDVVADVFDTVLKIIDRYNGESKFSTFLLGIAINKSRQFWQKKQKLGEVSYLEEIEYQEQEEDTEEEIAKYELLNKYLHEIIAELPDNYREVIECRFLQQLSINETADKLGISGGNVRVIQNRAIKKAQQIADRKYSKKLNQISDTTNSEQK